MPPLQGDIPCFYLTGPGARASRPDSVTEMIKRNKSEYIIHSVDHTFDVLEAFRAEEPELGVTQLSKILKLHKNNVFRILATLENRGYVEQNPRTGNYRLGLKAFETGQAYLRHTNLLSVSHSEMSALATELRENAYLAVLRGDYVFYLDEAIAEQTIQVKSRLGTRVAPHCTATGKVFLAYVGPGQREEILGNLSLERLTPNTITDKGELLEEIEKVAAEGFALDNEEWKVGLKCIAAPILDYFGKIQGTLSVSGPADRLPEKRVREEVIRVVMDHAREISRKMGYNIGKGKAK